jgi:protein Mpv17
MLANWKIWPAANALSFAVVPLQYRVLFSNMVALVWNIYLSGAIRK